MKMRYPNVVIGILGVVVIIAAVLVSAQVLRTNTTSYSPAGKMESRHSLVIGQPCFDEKIRERLAQDNPDGLQCYFYDGREGNREGIILRPDITWPSFLPESSNYELSQKYFSGWKEYTSKDKNLSFKYHPSWKVVESPDVNDGNITIQTDFSDIWPISISRVPDNAVSIEDRIAQDKRNSAYLEIPVKLGDTQCTLLKIESVVSNAQASYSVYCPRDGYYISMNFTEYGVALYDALLQYLFASIKIN